MTGTRFDELTYAARTYHRALQAYERQAAETSEDCLGPERDVFLRALAGIKFVLERATPAGEIADDILKAKLACGNRGFVLLWASWRDILAARYAAAAEHWRSLYETPYFVLAFSIDSALARDWLKGNADFDRARRIIRRLLKDRGKRRDADDWEQRHKRFDSQVQRFSHVTAESSITTLPTAVNESGQTTAIILTTQVTPRKTREYALSVARDAMELLRACAWAFDYLEEVRVYWESFERDVWEDDVAALRDTYSRLGLGDGTDGK